MNILEKIVQTKKKEIEYNRENNTISKLEESPYMDRSMISISQYVRRDDKSGIIAEFKRRSPSKPSINLDAEVRDVCPGYMMAGASALSVLTDVEYFGGSSSDLTRARELVDIPVLRKDFIIDEYQIIEAKSIGADAILLISEILDKNQVKRFSEFAHSMDLEVLLELHSEDQLSKYCDAVDMIGVNNRDLKTFTTDIQFSKNLISKLPEQAVKISESGIINPSTISELKAIGYEGFLIGERFMMSDDPAKACEEFINQIP